MKLGIERPAIFGLLVVAVASICLFSCDKKPAPTDAAKAPAKTTPVATSKPFPIGMVTFAGYGPLFVAKEKNYFDGLDVDLRRIEEIASLRAGMTSGDLAAYIATPDIAQDTDQRPPGIAIWAIDESAGGDGVVVASGISGISSLKGKNIAAEPGLPPHFVMMYLLHQNGLSLSDVVLKQLSTQNAKTAFVNGEVDAAGLYEPYLSSAVKELKGSSVAISSKQTPGLIVDLIFVRQETLRDRRTDVVKLVQGWRKAVSFVQEKPEESFAIMAKSFGMSVEEFKDAAGGVVWLNLDQNRQLFGTQTQPGPLYHNFQIVNDVLKRNRATVYPAKADESLVRSVVEELK